MNAVCAAAAQLWPASERATAYGVCMAESHGNPNAHCFNCFPGVVENSEGEFQVNIDAHPQYASWNLFDPMTDAKAAYQIWQGSGWGAWSTYNNGDYLKYAGDYGGAPVGASAAPAPQTTSTPWLLIGAGALLILLIRHHGG